MKGAAAVPVPSPEYQNGKHACRPPAIPVPGAPSTGQCTRCACAGACLQVGACTVSFNTDSVHISRPPRQLRTLEAQLALLAEQLLPHNPRAAAACSGACAAPAAAGSGGASGAADAALASAHELRWSACFAYRLPDPSWADADGAEVGRVPGAWAWVPGSHGCQGAAQAARSLPVGRTGMHVAPPLHLGRSHARS